MTLVGSLFAIADAYVDATGLSRARIATLATNEGKFFSRLEGGASVTERRYMAMAQWFSENWPEGATWPADVERPTPRGRAA